ncbi:MAG: PEP-CTERM sorting domain-containing protein [Desulfobacterales bacterium]|nr:PEP-CTERM sorting domain-containing protein [Desulfobacterales bacterium]MBF0396476.1 PEP-CTERM sorting domain-containing protein [Desulfobacterales bacterium]
MKNALLFLCYILTLVIIFSSNSQATPIYGNTESGGLEKLGSFTGELLYNASNDNSATLTFKLTNNSTQSNGGYLTAFAFLMPNASINVERLVTPLSNFNLLKGPISAAPFDNFDIGVSISDSWLGGGNPNKGLNVSNTGEFTFYLTGTGLSKLTVDDFTRKNNFLAARFRGFQDGGSDKVPAAVAAAAGVPEPSILILLGSGLIGLGIIKRKKKNIEN